jgi:4'-phosphopantetheinyl transferase EntD
VSPVSDRCTTPFPAELRAVATAVPARRREFVCGRACAHQALQALGAVDAPIPMGSARAPVWPSGVVGSISHTRDMAGAVVCRSVDAHALGLDLERTDAPMDASVRRLVLTPRETDQLAELRSDEQRMAVLMFSAKECVHKVTGPLWGVNLDPQDVEIAIDLVAWRFTARAIHAPRELHGAFTFFDDHVATGICLVHRPEDELDSVAALSNRAR